jgi:hypothetical protein
MVVTEVAFGNTRMAVASDSQNHVLQVYVDGETHQRFIDKELAEFLTRFLDAVNNVVPEMQKKFLNPELLHYLGR